MTGFISWASVLAFIGNLEIYVYTVYLLVKYGYAVYTSVMLQCP